MSRIPNPLKWHGGKYYLAPKIIALMPPRDAWCHYVEPYFGGGSVLLANDPEGISEVVNDANGELTRFWCVLQGKDSFAEFQRILQATPFSEVEWEAAQYSSGGIVGAARFFVRCRQSMAGRMKHFAPISRNRTRGGMNEQASAWLSAVDGLAEVHARLRRVVILNRDALEVIRSQDGPKTLFYLDPPYLHETRTTTSEYGDHEMDGGQHKELLDVLGAIEGRFLLSGYHSDLYDAFADAYDWKCHEFDLPNNAASGEDKRRMIECVWTNY